MITFIGEFTGLSLVGAWSPSPEESHQLLKDALQEQQRWEMLLLEGRQAANAFLDPKKEEGKIGSDEDVSTG